MKASDADARLMRHVSLEKEKKMVTKEIQIVQSFNNAINEGNAERLSSLMTEDHTFIDASGTAHSGVRKMTEGWKDFFRMFPDYKNNFESILQDGNLVVALGTASGTYNGNRGLIPENQMKWSAAWKAIVENDKIKVWQVYADWTEAMKIIDEDQKAGKPVG
ncbi:MAG: nuclear transport factor 2 family protein [Syntrophaceae bacterium]|nr:nuclear transport factor 2 family protein [Syntrophaceae bacterium]